MLCLLNKKEINQCLPSDSSIIIPHRSKSMYSYKQECIFLLFLFFGGVCVRVCVANMHRLPIKRYTGYCISRCCITSNITSPQLICLGYKYETKRMTHSTNEHHVISATFVWKSSCYKICHLTFVNKSGNSNCFLQRVLQSVVINSPRSMSRAIELRLEHKHELEWNKIVRTKEDQPLECDKRTRIGTVISMVRSEK